MWNSYVNGKGGFMRTILIMTKKEKRRYAAHLKTIAEVGIRMENLAAAMNKAALAAITLKDTMKICPSKREK